MADAATAHGVQPAKPQVRAWGDELAGFEEASSRGRLVVRRCDACLHLQWPPRSACQSCLGGGFDWVEIGGRGHIYTWTEVHRSSLEDFAGSVPYIVCIVEMDESPDLRMLGLLEGGTVPSIGVPVHGSAVSTGTAAPTIRWTLITDGDEFAENR
ncbi:OB-fold domain-containing protein [Aeromicrobium sp.]|uniref:Zn-ribbon domain-containing OB-fold protein n=1 Tax=Aeromicrobium sp. TaxID=1871063 RepID=UPI0034401B3F|nr:OB-fold domain-containing protein [Aeromicrobium sp.]